MKASVVLIIFLSVTSTVYGDCPRPTGGPNTVLITDITFPAPEGTSLTFGCEVGYRKVDGPGTVVCSGGKWTDSNMKCQIRNCGSAGEVNNGRVDYSQGTEFGAFAQVVCYEGFRPVGADKQVYCGVNGWTGRLQTCEVSMCDQPNPITNGFFTPMKDEYEYLEVITYSCNGDNKLNGSRTAACQDDGQFRPAPPKCVSVNCSEPRVDNAVVASGSRPPYKHQSSVTFRCKVGYNMVGQDTVSCDINSKWSPEFPKCNPVECKAPEITNGEVSGGSRNTYKFGETVTLKCLDDYKLSGQSTLTCGERNQWSASFPVCTPIQCQAPEVEGGVLVGGPRPSYKHKDTVTFECISGHALSGESTLTCDVNSQWSPKPPKCTQIQCPTPRVEGGVLVAGSRPSYKHKDTVTFECISGHTLSGDSTLTCGDNSQWSPKLPKCTPVECSAPEVNNGQVVGSSRPSYKLSESVVLECKSGYTMSGGSTLKCGPNRQWSPELPQCTKNKGNTTKIVLGVLGGIGAFCLGAAGIYFGFLKKKKGDGKYTGASQDAENVALS